MGKDSSTTRLDKDFAKALQLHQAAKFDAAEALYRRNLAAHPKHAASLHYLGVLLIQTARFADAVTYIGAAIAVNPASAEYQYNLGLALFELGRFEEASASYSRAIALNPAYVQALSNRGNAHKELGRMADAAADYRAAIAHNPAFAEAHSNLGFVLLELGQAEEAIVSCKNAIRLKPGYVRAYLNLGNALRDLNRHDVAAETYRLATRLAPNLADTHGNLAGALLELGKFDAARAAFETALRLDPHNADLQRNFAQLHTFKENEPQLLALQKAFDAATTDAARMHAGFALAKASEDIGDFDRAFELLLNANRLRKKQLAYSFEHDRAIFTALKAAFTDPAAWQATPALAPAAPTPILIVGMPRSGTSLVEQILAAHGSVHSAGELNTLNIVVGMHINRIATDGLPEVSRTISDAYQTAVRKLAGGKSHITDKMPVNFRWIGFLLAARPDARIVHITRDRMAVCWSNFKHYFPAPGMGYAFDLADIAAFYRHYEDLMRFWHERFPGRIHELNYETLTENQEQESRCLLDYCGLAWQDQCLHFEKTERAVRTASAVQVRQGIYRGSSEAWRHFEKHLGVLRET